MKITWLGHACFMLEEDGYRIVLDPYTGVEGYPELDAEAHAVLCSHGHQDHNAAETVRLTGAGHGTTKPQPRQCPAQRYDRLRCREVESDGHAGPETAESTQVQPADSQPQKFVAPPVVMAMAGKGDTLFPQWLHFLSFWCE